MSSILRHGVAHAVARVGGPLLAWESLVSSGVLTADAKQQRIVRELQRVHVELAAYTPPSVDVFEKHVFDLGSSSDTATTTCSSDDDASSVELPPPLLPPPPPPRGLYIHGSVGSGKSMLMDLFFEHAVIDEASGRGKRRTHFQPFIDETMETLHAWRAQDESDGWREAHSMGMLRGLAKAFAEKNALLCFDEVQFPDPASAMVMQRLLFFLLQHGVVLVSTSNRAPHELHAGGVVPSSSRVFSSFLTDRCDVKTLHSADYRRQLAEQDAGGAEEQCYFTPLGNAARVAMEERWCTYGGGSAEAPAEVEAVLPELTTFGRRVDVDRISPCGRACWFDFDDLCGSRAARGPADYLTIAKHFECVFIANVPELALSMSSRNEARRLIWFIDAAYESRTKIVVSAATKPDSLFSKSVGRSDDDDIMLKESLGSLAELRYNADDGDVDAVEMSVFSGADDIFAFERCSSRMIEMSTTSFNVKDHQQNNAVGFGLQIPSPPPPPTPPPLKEGEEGEVEDAESTMARHHNPVDIRVAPKFTNRHFYKMGRWGGKGDSFSKGRPRMGGPSPLEMKLESLKERVASWWK